MDERIELTGEPRGKYNKKFLDAAYINTNGIIEDQRTIHISKGKFLFHSFKSRKVGNDSFLIYIYANDISAKMGLLSYP